MANSYLTWQNSTATNSTKFTMSAWVKRGNLNSGSYNCIMSCRQTSSTNAMGLWFGEDKVFFNFGTSASASTTGFDTTAKVRDTSAWYHIVVAGDASQSGTDKLKVWINSTQQTSFVTDNRSSFATLANDFGNTTYPIQVGRKHDDTFFWDGYMSHVAFVDGTALTPSSFGETDSTSGIWKFKSPSGITWGNNGFHLKFENSGALGTDSSGNSNTFTVQGNLKQALDTPSNVHATLNGAFNLSDNVLSFGNNKAVNANSNWKYVPATLGVSSGKWYAEYKVNKGSGYLMNGVVDMRYATSQDANSYTHSGAGTGSVSIYSDSGEKYIAGSNTSYAGTYTDNNIIGVALDMDNNKVYFSKDGAWANGSGAWGSSTFDAAVGAITLPTTGIYTFAVSQRSGAYNEVNFGNGYFGTTAISSAGSNGNGSLFEYDVPSGYYALNTKNINTYG